MLWEGDRLTYIRSSGNFIHFTFFDREWSDQYYPSMRFVQWIRLLKRFPRVDRAEVRYPPSLKIDWLPNIYHRRNQQHPKVARKERVKKKKRRLKVSQQRKRAATKSVFLSGS